MRQERVHLAIAHRAFLLRACESFANLWGMKGLQQVVVVLLRGWGEWSEGEPVGVGR